MEELKGNRDGAIYKDGNSVLRPLNAWSKSVHKFLQHLHGLGIDNVPKVLSVVENTERLSFIEGATTDFPLEGNFAEERALTTAAHLLRRLHDASESFVSSYNIRVMSWMLPTVEPVEVICHGDFAPYNCAFNNSEVVGIFDFDTSHPAPRVWDLAYSVYCWSPFKSNAHECCAKTLDEQLYRAKVFCDAYGATNSKRRELPEIVAKRLRALVSFMLKEASLGNLQFSENIADGHHQSYLADIDYVLENKEKIASALLGTSNNNRLGTRPSLNP